MTRSVIEAPEGIEYGTVSEWRRSPAQPVTLLIDSTNPSLSPVRPKPAQSDTEACVRCRSGPDKAKPKSGRISALAGRQGRLRACTQHLQRHHSQPLRILVTTSIIKSDVVPGLWPGAASLFSGGEGHGISERRWFSAIRDYLYVVTTGSGARRKATGGTYVVSEPARPSGRCKGGHSQEPVHRSGDEQVISL